MTGDARSGTIAPVSIVLEHPVAARRASQELVWRTAGPTLLGLLVLLPAVAMAIDGTDAFEGFVARFHLFSYLGALSFGLVATLVAQHQVTHRVGLISAGIAWGFGVATVLDRYAILGATRGWPGVTWTLWAAQWVWVPALWSIPTLLALRFPDGRLHDERWRHIERLAITGIVTATVGWATSPYGKLDQEPATASRPSTASSGSGRTSSSRTSTCRG